MGRRYYCDYCDKLFIDDLEARKKHLQSSHHIKLRNLHYESCRGKKVFRSGSSLKKLYYFRSRNGFKGRIVKNTVSKIYTEWKLSV